MNQEILMFGKSVKVTDKTIFRVEESRNPKCVYEGVFAHKDAIQAIRYFHSTIESKRKTGFRCRLVKDGDEFSVLAKHTFA
jgi:hypothetical protein